MARQRKKRRLARLTRPLRDALTVPLLETLRRICCLLPHRVVLALGRAAGTLAWMLAGSLRHRSFEQMRRASIGRDDDERRRLVRAMFQSIGMNSLEWLHSTGWSDERVMEHIEFPEHEPGEAERAAGNGQINITAHMGNWEIFPRAYGIHTRRRLMILMAPQRSPKLNDWIVRTRSRGFELVMTEEGALKPLRTLRRGDIVALLADQDSTRNPGIFVDFFARPAYTPSGPAHLAYRTGAAILPMVIMRRTDDPTRHRVHYGEAIVPDRTAPIDEEVRRMTQEYTAQLERFIRMRPETWVWLHERWKHQPGDRIRVRKPRHRRPATAAQVAR